MSTYDYAEWEQSYNEAVRAWDKITRENPHAEDMRYMVVDQLQQNPGLTIENAFDRVKETVADFAGVSTESLNQEPEPASTGSLHGDIEASLKANDWKPHWERDGE